MLSGPALPPVTVTDWPPGTVKLPLILTTFGWAFVPAAIVVKGGLPAAYVTSGVPVGSETVGICALNGVVSFGLP